ncbi:MAG: helix-turn-helix domain-containing protein [Candidatus Omnitrophica bacterium]|nr:helix-turn-helix domain-containing protein [Candidatus Omnitrophota bacterium]
MNKKTLYNWVSEKRIPYVKMGNTLRFDIKEIEDWINKNRVKPHLVWDKYRRNYGKIH